MKLLPKGLLVLIATVAADPTVVLCAVTGTGGDLLAAANDPVFESGLAALKKATGIIEGRPGPSQTGWMPDLQLLVGVKAVEGSKRTIYFVEMTTLRPPPTNAAGQLWSPPLRTNRFDWSGTNGVTDTHKTAEYISSLYPVRLRVFDGSGRQLKEGEATMPWGLLTNGLADMCRLSMSLAGREERAGRQLESGASQTQASRAAAPAGNSGNPEDNDELMRSFGGGFLWLMTMFGQLQNTPALNEIWEKAHCAFRLPGVWSAVKSVLKGSLVISLEPRLNEVTLAHPEPAGAATRSYRLPVDLNHGKRNLTRVEIIVGPASGAEMLLAGIRSIRAVHPARPKQEFTARILVSGNAAVSNTGQ